MDSILDTIKQMIGVSPDNTSFDVNITNDINSVLSILNQMGFGPIEGYSIIDKNNKWSELIGDRKNADLIKSYIHKKVKMLFDPPTSAAAMAALERIIAELEWRINNL